LAPNRRSLWVSSLSVRNVRNLERVDLEAGPRFNVIAGDNGQGKTNLIEAVYLLATSKSFRVARPGDVLRIGEAVGSVRGTVVDDGEQRVQSVGLEPRSRVAVVDGKRAASLLAYALRSPAVVFHPGEMSLSMGGGTERRRLLDRVGLYLQPEGTGALVDCTRALRSRQRALQMRGPGASDLDQWEEILVRNALEVMAHRRRAAVAVREAARVAFEQIAGEGGGLEVEYAPGAPEDGEKFRDGLRANRVRDERRGAATLGPHRDDLVLTLGGRVARGIASQGQHRAIVLALKASEVEVISGARGTRPVLLLDDVSSELDRRRTAALFAFLQRHEGQVFLTTTRPELIDTGDASGEAGRVDFRVLRGAVEKA
jgi:DNA replication and repair protein RecF